MKYKELIQELEYWKDIIGEENPEVVINTPPHSYIMDGIRPVKGVKNIKAIGIIFEL